MAAAALATPYSEEVRYTVIDVLLQIVLNNSLRPHVPVELWAWLKRQPSPSPVIPRREARATTLDAVRHIRELGDIEILKPYLLLSWSEWTPHCDSGIAEMETAIREDFWGTTARRHRKDLAERLDRILFEPPRASERFGRHYCLEHRDDIKRAQRQYGRLRRVLREVDRSALEVLPRMPSESILCNKRANPNGRVQNPIQPSLVLFLFHAHNFTFEAVGPSEFRVRTSTCARAFFCSHPLDLFYDSSHFHSFVRLL